MSGWRHFGLKLDDECEEIKTILALSGNLRARDVEIIDGFYCEHRWGYERDREDRDLEKRIGISDERGYYVHANNTTDTGGGLIRFRRHGDLVRIADLVDDSIEKDEPDWPPRPEKEPRFPEFQLGSPAYPLVYELLDYEHMPVLQLP